MLATAVVFKAGGLLLVAAVIFKAQMASWWARSCYQNPMGYRKIGILELATSLGNVIKQVHAQVFMGLNTMSAFGMLDASLVVKSICVCSVCTGG